MLKLLILSCVCIGFSQQQGLQDYGLTTDVLIETAAKIASNTKLFKYYQQCIIDEGPCDRIGNILKDVTGPVIRTACGICSDVEKPIVRAASHFAFITFNEIFNKMLDAHDPDEIYREAYLNFVFDK